MAVFVTLRIENDDEARTLLKDMAGWPGDFLLTPSRHQRVYAKVESTETLAEDVGAESLRNLRTRLETAERRLMELADNHPSDRRINGKVEGVVLAISYINEAQRMAGRNGDVVTTTVLEPAQECPACDGCGCERPWCVDCQEADAAGRLDEAVDAADTRRRGE